MPGNGWNVTWRLSQWLAEGELVDAAIAAARSRFPLAHVTMEHPDEVVDGRVVHAREAQLAVDGDPLGWVHPHGIPVWL